MYACVCLVMWIHLLRLLTPFSQVLDERVSQYAGQAMALVLDTPERRDVSVLNSPEGRVLDDD